MGREMLLWVREDRDRGGGKNMGKAPLPKSSWRESGKLEITAGTKLKREKGEKRKEMVKIPLRL